MAKKKKAATATKAKPAASTKSPVTKGVATKSATKPGKKKAAPSRMQKMGEAVSHAAAKVAAEAKAVVSRVGARRATRQATLLHLVGAETLAKKADKRAAGRKKTAASATKAAKKV